MIIRHVVYTKYGEQWEPLDNGEFETYAEAADAIEQLKALGDEWADAEYMIREERS